MKKGDNTKDFKVTPYIRIKNPKIEKNGNQIVATFSLEGGKGDEKLASLSYLLSRVCGEAILLSLD